MKALHGIRIVNTRAVRQASSLTEEIQQRGGISIEIPLIVIQEPVNQEKRNEHLTKIHIADWLVFTSVNSFHYTLKALSQQQLPVEEIIRSKKIAAVGVKTAAYIRGRGYSVDIVPATYDAEHLAELLIADSKKAERFFYPKSSLSRKVILEKLTLSGRIVDEMVAYETVSNHHYQDRLNLLIENQQVDVVIFTSPSAAHSFFEQINNNQLSYVKKKLTFAVIGRVTEETLLRYDCRQVLVPEIYTIESILTLIEKNKDQL